MKMAPVFLSIDARKRDNWCEAFPELAAARLDAPPLGDGLVWLLQPAGRGAAEVIVGLAGHLSGRPLVLLADEPSQDEAMAALAAGAAGYCNGHAAPEVLRQVATVVENGGIWVGRGLMQRLLTATARLAPADEGREQAWRAPLTPREQEAAVLLAPVRTIVFGVLIVGFLILEPHGLAEIWQRIRRFFHLWPFRT